MIIDIPGKPIPKGSTRAFKHNRTGRIITLQQNADSLYAYQDRIAHECRKSGAASVDLPISVSCEFSFARPKSHRKSSGALRDSAPRHHVQRPDADKLLRSVVDALTGVCFTDDSQVINATATKRWGDADSTRIVVMELPE